MDQAFKIYVSTHRLFLKNEKILIAVSGGVDSMVLMQLMHQVNKNIAVAHCNFGLRGNESNVDEQFVKQMATDLNIPFHSTYFKTESFASEQKISIQMAARQLRYEWFEKLRTEFGYHLIATAHHATDQVETILLNLTKGTGLAGMKGILPRHGKIIRPLLFASKEEIVGYASENKIKFREDSSNASDKYQRNKIRHHVFPVLKEINPRIEQTIAESINHFVETDYLFQEALISWRKKIVHLDKEKTTITLHLIQKHPAGHTILFHLISEFGFNSDQVKNILTPKEIGNGKEFLSATHRMVTHRQTLFIEPITEHHSEILLIHENLNSIQLLNSKITASIFNANDFSISKDPNNCCVDFSKIEFPVVARKWRAGDYFYPFGMKSKKKKLSNFFIDKKLSVPEKEKVWVLESNKKIFWVVGHRIDDRFRITSSTKKVLCLQQTF